MRAAKKPLTLKEYFADIDSDFVGIEKTQDTTYVYNATDVLVQTTWELPIVVQYPESTVQFEFCSNPGDISFGIVFVAAPEEGQDPDDLEIETVEEMGLVRSNLEAISGSFEVPCEGVIFFMWDNNFDWSATKQISYLIEVTQPAFRFIDQLRVEKCLPLLKETVEDLNASYVRSADAHDCIDHNSANVSFLEDQLQSLERKRAARQREREALEAEIASLEQRVERAVLCEPGLCIRTLNKALMLRVLGYLNPAGGINKVCKYWADLGAELRQLSEIPPLPKPTLPTHLLKRTKSEIKTDLAQIKASVMLRELSRVQAAQSASSTSSSNGISNGGKAKSTAGSQSSSPSKEKEKAHSSTAALTASAAPSSSIVDSAAAAVTESIGTTNNNKGRARAAARAVKAAFDVSDTSDSDGNDDDSIASGVRNNNSAIRNKDVPVTSIDPVKKLYGKAPEVLQRTNSAKSNGNNVRVSFDNLLPPTHTVVHSASFTTKTSPVTPPSTKTVPAGKKKKSQPNEETGQPHAISNKHHPQPAQEDMLSAKKDNEVANFANNMQWGREREAGAGVGAGESAPSPKLPIVAESKRRNRVKVSKTDPAAEESGIKGAPTAKKTKGVRLADTENNRNLLQHVKKVRSEQQKQQMIEYLQAGYVKVETLALEKRRIKKLIKAWNNSFEKKTGRLPTSSDRKGHLRELYEEYHQVSLALRIRTEKMEESLKVVGLTQEEFLALRDKKISDW